MARCVALAFLIALMVAAVAPVAAQQGIAAATAKSEGAELAKKLSNPISDLVSVPFQLNWQQGVGPDDQVNSLGRRRDDGTIEGVDAKHMKTTRKDMNMALLRWTVSLLLPVALATSAWAQEAVPPDRNAGSRQAAVQTQPAPAATGAAQPGKADSGWKGEFDPIYGWLPFFSTSVTLPEFPNIPSPPGGATGNTGAELNGALMFALRLEKSRFAARGDVLWAGLKSKRDTPNLDVSLHMIYGEFFGGFAVSRGLYLEGGVRRIATHVQVTLLQYPEVDTKPGLWDPLVGMTYRAPMGKKWLLNLHGDYGGFGVGSDHDVSFNGGAEWTAAKHFGMSVGYQYLYLRFSHTVLSGTALNRDLKLGLTMQGPTLALRIPF